MPTLARVALVSCLFLYAFCPSAAAYRPRSLDEFRAQRDRLRDSQSASDFQSDAPPLNEREQLANAVIMRLKRAALDDGFVNPGRFNPAAHFFETRNATRASKLFRCMRRMPKGGILHAHDMALVSIDHLITITYRPLLWQCWDTSGGRIAAFRFSLLRPTHVTCSTGWKRTKEERKRVGAPKFDAIVRSQFSLRDGYPYADINAVWQRFEAIFDLVEPMLTYIDVWQDLIRQALAEAWADGVQYLELRTMLLALHDENGQVYDDASDLVRMYAHVVDEFKQRTPKFVGAKIIYAPMRQVPNERVAEYVQQVVQLQREHPDFVVGFDVVGQEDVGRTLASMAEVLVTVPSQVGLFYHAGETNWHGNQVDENLFDAIALGARRIGHGYALAKYPTLMQLVKERDIAIEVNPVSNQVLKLVADLRNHPAVTFFAQNMPLVISSDDPGFWEALPLTDDFYAAFMGLANAHADLRTLKKLALSSFYYSSMNANEYAEARLKWDRLWTQFVENVIADRC